MERFAAVVLAGGAGRRLGGAAKPSLPVAGRRMLDRVLAAVAEAAPLVVVGHVPGGVPAGVISTVEDPPGSGPVAAAAAGVALLPHDADVVALLAADLPFLTRSAVAHLRRHLESSTVDGALYLDGGGRRQLLCGVWRASALRAALDRLAGRDQPLASPGAVERPGGSAVSDSDLPGAEPSAAVAESGRDLPDGARPGGGAASGRDVSGGGHSAAGAVSNGDLHGGGAVSGRGLPGPERPASGAASGRGRSGSDPAGNAPAAGQAARPERAAGPGRAAATERAAHDFGRRGLAGAAMRALIAELDVREVAWHEPGPPPWFDCDTDDDLRQAEEWAR